MESLKMLDNCQVVVVMPAYNAEKTLEQTVTEIPPNVVDKIILVDDASHDNTVEIAKKLGLDIIVHPENRGYGANQKSCYTAALKAGADIVIMLHPDYQYTPRLVLAFASMLSQGVYDVVLGSRILGKGALEGGMPIYKYIANRFLTLVENILINQKLSEYHTGYRGFRRQVLESIPWQENSDDFIFDNQILAQAHHHGFRIGEISCPTKYFEEASSINFRRSVTYGLGVLLVALQYRLHRWGWLRSRLFSRSAGRSPLLFP
jgi:glycosyltransferase involved in cell wall biosynthesis